MQNNETSNSAASKKKFTLIINIVCGTAIAAVLIMCIYFFVNPENLSDGKKLAKAGDHEGAISEFIEGINNNTFTGRGSTRIFKSLSYKTNLHSLYYNIGLSFEALGEIAEDDADVKATYLYYAYALEAYNDTIRVKEKYKKAIESKQELETEFIDLFGETYVYGSIIK